ANGGRVDASGRTIGRILGPALDGTHGLARVPDSDGGELDTDRVWDRAVGPMQLLPSVWRRDAADRGGGGSAGPRDVVGAALTAGRFLCAGGTDLEVPDAQAAAVLRYRRSTSYLAAVRSWSAGYTVGARSVPVAVPVPVPVPTPVTPAPRLAPRPGR